MEPGKSARREFLPFLNRATNAASAPNQSESLHRNLVARAISRRREFLELVAPDSLAGGMVLPSISAAATFAAPVRPLRAPHAAIRQPPPMACAREGGPSHPRSMTTPTVRNPPSPEP